MKGILDAFRFEPNFGEQGRREKRREKNSVAISTAPVWEQLHGILQGLLPPLPDLVRMNTELAGQAAERLAAPLPMPPSPRMKQPSVHFPAILLTSPVGRPPGRHLPYPLAQYLGSSSGEDFGPWQVRC